MAELENKMIVVRHPCSLCARDNRHVVLYSHTETQHEFYEEEIYQIVKCGGCESISFRKVVRDYQQATPLEDGEWYVPEKVSCYPNILKNYRELQEEWMLPDAVREIYTQSIEAIKSNSNVLAGMGLRATIEAICNDCSIAGKSLEKRIDSLAKVGLISQKDAERLHAIRFLGNDAAHIIKKSDSRSLLIALRIIEHLLVNIYILDKEADGQLEMIVRSFSDFLVLLEKCQANFNSGDERPLVAIFGRDMRRLHTYADSHERSLIEQIKNGDYQKLRLGKIDHFASSEKKFQYFVIV